MDVWNVNSVIHHKRYRGFSIFDMGGADLFSEKIPTLRHNINFHHVFRRLKCSTLSAPVGLMRLKNICDVMQLVREPMRRVEEEKKKGKKILPSRQER